MWRCWLGGTKFRHGKSLPLCGVAVPEICDKRHGLPRELDHTNYDVRNYYTI